MLLSLRKNGLTSLFKEVTVFKALQRKSLAFAILCAIFRGKWASQLRFGWRRERLRQKITVICDWHLWCSQVPCHNPSHSTSPPEGVKESLELRLPIARSPYRAPKPQTQKCICPSLVNQISATVRGPLNWASSAVKGSEKGSKMSFLENPNVGGQSRDDLAVLRLPWKIGISGEMAPGY